MQFNYENLCKALANLSLQTTIPMEFESFLLKSIPIKHKQILNVLFTLVLSLKIFENCTNQRSQVNIVNTDKQYALVNENKSLPR